MRRRTFLITLAVLVAMVAGSLSSLVAPTPVAEAQTPEPTWFGEYYDNPILARPVAFTRYDSEIAFDWGTGSPGSDISADEFSARWTAEPYFDGGTYRFWARADDHVSVTIDFRYTVIDTFDTDRVNDVVSADIDLSAGTHHIQVDYQEISQEASVYVDFANLAEDPQGPDFAPPAVSPPTGTWTAQYFANRNLAGPPPVVRSEAQAGGDWGAGSPASLPPDNWSARWNSAFVLDGGDYRIRAEADDGIRVYIDGVLVINEWHVASGREYIVTRTLTAGTHSVTVEFFEGLGLAFVDFSIEPISGASGPNVATVIDGPLNVRDAPNTVTGDILTRVFYGETFTALARTAEANWVKINVDGTIGWVSEDFVTVSNLSGLPVEGPQTQPTGYTVTAFPYAVNIRTGPSTEYEILAFLPRRSTAQVLGRNEDATWWQIRYDGTVGWVSAPYAVIEEGADISTIPVTG